VHKMSLSGDIPWIRLIAESSAIIASILLAFTIDAWWSQRQEIDEAQQILLNLHAEFSDHKDRLEDALLRMSDRMENSRQLLMAISTKSEVPASTADQYIWSLMVAPTFDPPSGARDAVIASGDLEIVPNPQLRAGLATWQTTIDEVRDNQLAMRDFILTTLDPYLARQGVPISRIQEDIRNDVSLPKMSDEDADQIYRSLFADPEFEALAAIRYGWFNPEEVEGAIARAEEILSLIELELTEPLERPDSVVQ
jgi:hypothetical protein